MTCSPPDLHLSFSSKPIMAKLRDNPKAGIGRGKPAKPSQATAPGTPTNLCGGTLKADNLIVTGAGKKLSDRFVVKKPAASTSSTKTAEVMTNDVARIIALKKEVSTATDKKKTPINAYCLASRESEAR